MWRLGGQLYSLCLHYTAEMQKEYGMNSVFVLICRDAPEIGLYEFVFLCKGKLVVVLFLDIILFSVSLNSSLLISAFGCTSPDCLFFSNLLSNRSLIYLRACVRGKTLFLLNCDCSKSSGRENNSITLKHWELSQRLVVYFRAPDFSCRH